AAMEVAWFLPFALALFIRIQPERTGLPALLLRSGTWSPLVFFVLCWGTLLAYLLTTDLLNQRRIDFPRRELLMIAMIIVTFLITARLLLFPARPLLDISWLGTVLGAIFNQGPGSSAVFFLLMLNLFLWLRVAVATDRSLTFFSVGVSFRLGVLLTLVGNSWLMLSTGLPIQDSLSYLWLFFTFGLLAIALARVDEKAFQATQSSGGILPWPRFLQLVLTTLLAVGLAAYAAHLYTPSVIRAIVGWFSPLWRVLGAVALRIFSVLFWFLTPLLEWLSAMVRSLLAQLEPIETGTQAYGEVELQSRQLDLAQLMRDHDLIRYLLIGIVLLIVFALIAFFVARTRERIIAAEEEESHSSGMDFGRNPLHRLRDLAALFRRYGLRPGLLAAISVQNIYANVSRLAARRGYSRGPAQPPAEYLRALHQAFPGYETTLSRLTAAYMRVHYGDQHITTEELSTLRNDYAELHEVSQRHSNLQRLS
ncbi:MAG: DUF4129 domain-containing protein, partial [Caldilineaceae bacterium]|nr:DUF4129 domain-containing protein [Caldilineaceae bacterium]